MIKPGIILARIPPEGPVSRPFAAKPAGNGDSSGGRHGKRARSAAGTRGVPHRLRVGKVIGRNKVAKHFDLEIADDGFAWRRNAERIAEALDGLYVVRTSLRKLGAEDTVRAYKGLSRVERAFRSVKTVDLKIRPIHRPERVRAHVLLCMLAYHVEWHMRQKLAPVLFDEDDPADAARASIVAPAVPSARRKAARKRTPDGVPVHSFHTILDNLATIARNRVQPKLAGAPPFDLTTKPTKLQCQALDLLGVSL